MRQCHGFITLDSVPGRGSVFAVYLPLADEPASLRVPADGPAPARAVLSAQPSGRAAGQRTVLLAEDDEGVRPVVETMLRHLGFHVLVSTNGREALARAAGHPGHIDLLLTDVLMPELTGPQLAEALQHTRPGIPVLYMSGYTNDEAVRTLTGADGAPYLQKPFDAETLARHLDQVLGATRPAAIN